MRLSKNPLPASSQFLQEPSAMEAHSWMESSQSCPGPGNETCSSTLASRAVAALLCVSKELRLPPQTSFWALCYLADHYLPSLADHCLLSDATGGLLAAAACVLLAVRRAEEGGGRQRAGWRDPTLARAFGVAARTLGLSFQQFSPGNLAETAALVELEVPDSCLGGENTATLLEDMFAAVKQVRQQQQPWHQRCRPLLLTVMVLQAVPCRLGCGRLPGWRWTSASPCWSSCTATAASSSRVRWRVAARCWRVRRGDCMLKKPGRAAS